MVTSPVRREVVREVVARGLSERRALTVGWMSASAFRYMPRPDGNEVVRDRIIDLAQRHRRDGAGMIYLKLRQAGHVINHKRVDRLYTEARLQWKRRRRKKVPIADRQPLARPEHRHQVWSADFRRSSAPRAMNKLNKLSRLSAPLGRPIEGQIRAQAQWSRPIVRHPDSYPRSGGCQAEVRRAVFDAKGSGQRWAWPPLRLEPEPQVSTRRSIRPSTRGQHRTPCGS